MEKIIKRVFKRDIGVKVLIILLAIFTLSASYTDTQKVEVVKKAPIEYNMVDLQKESILLKQMVAEEPQKVVVEKAVVIPKTQKPEVKKVAAKPKKLIEARSTGKWTTYTMTHYVSNCAGCSGITRSGYDVRSTTKYKGMRILAVDPRRIKEGSIVQINDGGKIITAIALDTGGAIKGRRLDLLVKGVRYANDQGRKQVELRVVRNGWRGSVVKPKEII